MTQRQKKWLFNVLRLLLCAGLLWIVSRGVTLRDRLALAGTDRQLVGTVIEDPAGESFQVTTEDGRELTVPFEEVATDEQGDPKVSYGLGSVWRLCEKKFLLLAVLIMIPVGALQGVRFRILLLAQTIRIRLWDSIKIAFAGNFLNFAAPMGSTGGDVFKAYYVSLYTEHKTEAITTVFLDRMVGLLSLIIIVFVMSMLAPGGSLLAEFRTYTLSILGLGILGALIYLSPFLRERLKVEKLLERVPLGRQLKRVDNAARALAAHKAIFLAGLMATFVLQGAAMFAFFIVAVSLDMRAHVKDLLEYYAYFSTGAVVQALPGPPQGLGTVELAYRVLFKEFGSPTQIVCMALGIRAAAFTASLPGLLVTLTGAYRPKELNGPAPGEPPSKDPTDESRASLTSSLRP
jgi:uncharacterized protein (TIRG00374 family)